MKTYIELTTLNGEPAIFRADAITSVTRTGLATQVITEDDRGFLVIEPVHEVRERMENAGVVNRFDEAGAKALAEVVTRDSAPSHSRFPREHIGMGGGVIVK